MATESEVTAEETKRLLTGMTLTVARLALFVCIRAIVKLMEGDPNAHEFALFALQNAREAMKTIDEVKRP